MVKVDIAVILKSQLEVANATISQLMSQMDRMSKTIDDQSATIRSLELTIKNLEEQLLKKEDVLASAEAQKKALGKLLEKKNEKVKTSFVPMTQEEKDAEGARRDAERKARGNNGAKRNMHYEMEIEEKDVTPGDDIVLNKETVEIGVKDFVRYSMIPPRFIKTIYHNHAFLLDEKVYTGIVPKAPFQNSEYEASCIAGIAELRYLQSMPVERIVKYFEDHGFSLDKNTAHGFLRKTAELLKPLYEAAGVAVKEDPYIICDETYHKVLINAEENGGKGSMKGYMWGIIAGHLNLAYYFYENGSRRQDIIINKLENYSGTIQSDGLSAYKKVMMLSEGSVVRLACLQHCKRQLIDLQGNPDADRILEQANLLYANEHQHKIGVNGWTSEDNLRWRKQYAPPILRNLKIALLKVTSSPGKYPPKSEMYKAAQYFLNEFDGIEAIFRTSDCDLDTNRIERVNRYISTSRRNSLFFGSHDGAERGAIYYTLACSCRLCGVNFFDYLSDIIDRMAALPPKQPHEVYRNLLPDRWTLKS